MTNNSGSNNKKDDSKLQTEVMLKVQLPLPQPNAEESRIQQRLGYRLTHMAQLQRDKAWLLQGKKTMTPKFAESVYLVVLPIGRYMKLKKEGNLQDLEPIVDWMIENNKHDMQELRQNIGLDRALMKREEEDMLLKKYQNKKDGDSNGGNGSGGNDGLVC